jgi:hypothetical protein
MKEKQSTNTEVDGMQLLPFSPQVPSHWLTGKGWACVLPGAATTPPSVCPPTPFPGKWQKLEATGFLFRSPESTMGCMCTDVPRDRGNHYRGQVEVPL